MFVRVYVANVVYSVRELLHNSVNLTRKLSEEESECGQVVCMTKNKCTAENNSQQENVIVGKI